MRTGEAILKYLANQIGFISTRKLIKEALGLTDGQLSALYRLKLARKIVNISKGVWKLIKLYRKIRHTKRIVETSQHTKKRDWNCDCEATCEGFVPYFGEPDPPEIPDDSKTKRFGRTINPYLAERMLVVLARNGVILQPDYTSIEPTCSPRLVQSHGQFCIEGTEWLDDIDTTMRGGKFEVEVVFQSETGRVYPYYDQFTVSEEEFL